MRRKPVGNSLHYLDSSGHPYLHSIHGQVGHHRIYLRSHQLRPHVLHFGDTDGILHGHGSDSRSSITAAGRYRLDVCLDTGSTRWIRAGNRQYYRIIFHFTKIQMIPENAASFFGIIYFHSSAEKIKDQRRRSDSACRLPAGLRD